MDVNPAPSTATANPALISLLLPTRGRPELAERFFASVVKTAEHLAAIEVILYVDEDDPGSHQLDGGALHTVRIIGPNRSMGAYNTACYRACRGEIVVLVNDDMVMGTPGWDQALRNLHDRYADRIYLAYGNDLLKKRGLATFPILARSTCELLVDPYPETYAGAFIDVHLFDIFKRVQQAGFERIVYLPDVIFEHLHYRTGKASYDATYSKRGRFQDDPAFIQLADNRREAAGRVVAALQGLAPPTDALPPALGAVPATNRSAVWFYFNAIALDRQLPLRWRARLWLWFSLRHSAANGWLKPFVKG
ncbi:glycosyltransferase family 2 protein [Pseudomonas turukhanskensis]|uniref:Uncharacterized protein n=1 Tax=Pseudomonas turukhanskensis TaxID=1806536 RepID=A0A9W6K1F0_9PSED|nr:hypothetical protein [Pseudomonas turukhanskensis]GLK87736.1 hypothetical protein GCM10017655_07980 [Pseudomonas turukhanskensis]